MSLRLGLYRLAGRHGLDAAGLRSLETCAGLDEEPVDLPRQSLRAVTVLAAALLGLGLVLWIAANWNDLGRAGRFALVQAGIVVCGAAAMLLPVARIPAGLAGFFCVGGLFALFGQTYQTGADPWLLFALWAALTLPLCAALRSDVLWAPWALVAMTGISLWVHAHTGHRWRVEPDQFAVHLIGWGAAIATVVALGREGRALTGAGDWALRTAATLATAMIMFSALGGLFHSPPAAHYYAGLAVLSIAAGLFAQRRAFDIFVLSAIALALDVLLVTGLARLLFAGHAGEPIGSMLAVGLVAAGLLAASVGAVMRLARAHGVVEDAT
jgi:uncharacterized membrane protein